jgi:hypothetical protein
MLATEWGFGEVLWIMLLSFLFVSYLFVLFAIISDLFRDHQTSGWLKAVWVIFLLIAPILTALIYLIARGKGMAERSMKEATDQKQAMDQYIKSVAGGPADQLAQAKSLLDNGTITQAEFDQMKAKILA